MSKEDENFIKNLKGIFGSYESELAECLKKTQELEAEIKEKETQRIELMMKLNDVNNENHSLRLENEKLKDEVSRESYKVSEAYCFVEELKDLLKECRGLFNRATVDGAEPNNAELIGILTKIDEVLK